MACDYSEGIYLHSVCHGDWPTWVRIKGSKLIIECAEPNCGKLIQEMDLHPKYLETEAIQCENDNA